MPPPPKRLRTILHDTQALSPEERARELEAAAEHDPALEQALRTLAATRDIDLDAPGGFGALMEAGLPMMAQNVFGYDAAMPDHVGPYALLRVLGEGGMGTVYLGERTDPDRTVAVKILRDATLSPARLAQFEREQQTLADLSHPSIAHLYDTGVHNTGDVADDNEAAPRGTPYFVMEYVEGASITAYCTERRCSVQERLRLFRAVCEAVRYAHRQAILHRDLKPSNVYVSPGPDGKSMVKLLDFGIARHLDSLGHESDDAGAVDDLRLMTPAYAAPEQLRGEALGTYTDVYALGVLLYELLAGRHPYDLDGTEAEVKRVLLEAEAPPPSRLARTASENATPPDATSLGAAAWADLDALCLKAMERDPARRYASVEALLRNLDQYASNRPLDARPATLGYVSWKFFRRHRQRLSAVVIVLALVTALVTFYTLRLADARDAAVAEAETAERITDYLVSLFETSNPMSAQSGDVTVEDLLRNGVAQAEALAGEPQLQARMFTVLGRVHSGLSRYGAADTLLQRALALQRPFDNPLDRAETLYGIGTTRYLQGDFAEAEAALLEAEALLEQTLPPDARDLVSLRSELAVLYTEQARHDEAEPLLLAALAVQRGASDDSSKADLAQTLTNLGTSYINQGRPEEAEPLYREALALDREVFGPEHVRVAIQLGNLAVLHDSRFEHAIADSMLTESLRIRRAATGNDHIQVATGLLMLGSIVRKTGDLERAEAALREGGDIFARLVGEAHPNTAVARNQLALVLRDQEKLDEALATQRAALPVFQQVLGPDHYYTVTTTCQLAELLLDSGSLAEAAALYQQCVPALPSTAGIRVYVATRHQAHFGELRTAQGRYAEAESLLVASHDAIVASLGPDHEQIPLYTERLAQLYEAWGRPDAAASYRLQP
ncbi:MAG: serine/threonine-protein kinase [Bacteroidota bacterium]